MPLPQLLGVGDPALEREIGILGTFCQLVDVVVDSALPVILCFRLRLQAGLSYREIAEVTGLTVGNVGFHLHEAVRNLRDTLAVS